MGAKEAAASVVFAFEGRQLRPDGYHDRRADGGHAVSRHAAGTAASFEGRIMSAEHGGVADEQRLPRQEQPGQHAADGEPASRRPVPSGHLAGQLAGLRRKSMMRAKLEVSEI